MASCVSTVGPARRGRRADRPAGRGRPDARGLHGHPGPRARRMRRARASVLRPGRRLLSLGAACLESVDDATRFAFDLVDRAGEWRSRRDRVRAGRQGHVRRRSWLPPSTTSSRGLRAIARRPVRYGIKNAHLWGDLAEDEAAAALLASAMSTIDSRVEYADARLVEAEELRLYHQLDRDPTSGWSTGVGIGIRVLVDGSWGFAAAPLSRRAVPARVAERAIAVARAGVGPGSPVACRAGPPAAGIRPRSGSDPFAVTAAERDALLAQAIEAAAASRGVVQRDRRGSTPSASTGTSPRPRDPASTST